VLQWEQAPSKLCYGNFCKPAGKQTSDVSAFLRWNTAPFKDACIKLGFSKTQILKYPQLYAAVIWQFCRYRRCSVVTSGDEEIQPAVHRTKKITEIIDCVWPVWLTQWAAQAQLQESWIQGFSGYSKWVELMSWEWFNKVWMLTDDEWSFSAPAER